MSPPSARRGVATPTGPSVEATEPASDGNGSIVAVGRNRIPLPGDLEITVADHGCGIPHTVLESVFEPFFTTKPVGAGTGLGLAMVRGFVETAGGSLAVRSTVGAGTTFTIRLPRAPRSAGG